MTQPTFSSIANWAATKDDASLVLSVDSSGSYDPTTNKVRYAFAEWSSISVTSTASPTLTGGGLTWVLVSAYQQHTGGEFYMCAFRSCGIGSSGALTFTFGNAQTARYVGLNVIEVTDADTGGSDGATSVVRVVTDNTLLDATPSLAIAGGIASNNCALGYFARYGGLTAWTEDSDWTELVDATASNHSRAIQRSAVVGKDTCSGTFAAGGTPTVNGLLIEVKGSASAAKQVDGRRLTRGLARGMGRGMAMVRATSGLLVPCHSTPAGLVLAGA